MTTVSQARRIGWIMVDPHYDFNLALMKFLRPDGIWQYAFALWDREKVASFD